MAARPRWMPTLAISGAILVGCALAWRSYVSHHAFSATRSATMSGQIARGEEPGRALIYPDGAQADAEVAAALVRATKERKRVLLDFGGNWCGDCQVLEMYFHDSNNRALLESSYVLVPVNIGRFDQNRALAARYGVPLDKGVPALAVLSADGKLIFSQQHGEFEALRTLDSSTVTAFLQQWKD